MILNINECAKTSDILREMKEIEAALSAGSSPVGHPIFH